MVRIYRHIPTLLKSRVFCILILAVSAFIVSSNILANGFVWDDEMLILKNQWITDARYIPDILISSEWAFTEDVESHSNFYRPFFHLYCMAGYFLSGLDSWGYHLLNLIFHSANTVMVFLVLSLVLESLGERGRNAGTKDQSTISTEDSSWFSNVRMPAFIAALVFATHPIHVEPVAWTSASAQELTFTFFLLLSFYTYIRSGMINERHVNINHKERRDDIGQEEINPLLYSLSIVAFFLATLCKETALTLPMLLFLYDYAKKKRFNFSHIKKYIPYLMIIAVYFFLRGQALGDAVPTAVFHSYLNTYQTMINAFPLFVSYLWKLILPVNLSAFYILDPIYTLLEPRAIVSLVIVLLMAALIIWAKKVDRVIFFSLLWIVIPVLPVLYIPVVGRNPFAERYVYLSSVGFALLMAYMARIAVVWFNRRGKKSTKMRGVNTENNAGKVVLTVLMAIIIALYSVGTIKRNSVWYSDYTLWTETALRPPGNYFAYNFLGDTLSEKNMFEEAMNAYANSLRLGYLARHPDYNVLGSAHYNRGVIYGIMGLKEQALVEYNKAIKRKPTFFDAYYNTGIIYYEMSLVDNAIASYMKALQITKNSNDRILIHTNLGNAYAKKGLIKEAIAEYENVLKIDPANNIAGHNLNVLRRKE